jgi:hypothetical protein
MRQPKHSTRLSPDLCLTHSSSPIVWVIASRPEPHITSFFAQPSVQAAYEKEGIPVDSDEARSDVEKFLHTELEKIQKEFSLDRRVRWPSESDFRKFAHSSRGLSVYAHTVVKYIGDHVVGDPTAQLNDVLQVIEVCPLPDVRSEEHSMALLDALYARIPSKISTQVKANSRKLLLSFFVGWGDKFNK